MISKDDLKQWKEEALLKSEKDWNEQLLDRRIITLIKEVRRLQKYEWMYKE